MMVEPIFVARDERGELLAVELDQLPFEAHRIFIASAPVDGATRGNHTIPCAQIMILVNGRADVELGPDADRLSAPVILDVPGTSIPLPMGDYVRYRLHGPDSRVLVLAAEAYRPSER